MANVCQIGSGLIGSTMALDLAKEHKVYLADLDQSLLNKVKNKNPNIDVKKLDIRDVPKLENFISKADIVLTAVPGNLGFKLVKDIITIRKDVVDISFSKENLMSLDNLARENNVTVVFDAGVAPGIPNYILGQIVRKFTVTSFEYFVGGLPKHPKPPYNYKAPFSPSDVLEEYIRPARCRVDGNIKVLPALSDIVQLQYDKIGKLEAFNTDGLRSILETMPNITHMIEKTLRYPGHAKLIQKELLTKKIDIKNPKTLSSVFEKWKLYPNEEEFTILDVRVRTPDKHLNYFLFDETDSESGTTSMARTTGFTATATINLLIDGHFNKAGVYPPELISNRDYNAWNYIRRYLSDRKISIDVISKDM